MTALRDGVAAEEKPVSLHETALWKRLTDADDPAQFCSAWIALQCGMIAGATRGVVLTAGADRRPLAVWPDGTADDDLVAVAAMAMAQERGVVRTAGASSKTPGVVAYPVAAADEVFAAVAIALADDPPVDPRPAARQLQWGVAWLRERLQRRAGPARLGGDPTLDLLASTLACEGCRAACHGAVTALAHAFDCERVSIGFVRHGGVRVAAISHSAQFGEQMNLVRLIGDAMDEAIDQRTMLHHPAPADDAWVTRAHAELARTQAAAAVLTIPMLTHERFVGAVTLERASRTGFDADEIELLDGVVAALAPILEDKRRNDRPIAAKIIASFALQLERLLGPGHLRRKLAAIALAAAVAGAAWWTDTYRVTADAVVEGRLQRSVTAPFNGFVGDATARAGDRVGEGELLARLDDRDLVLERLRWVTERQRKVLEHERALGDRNRADVKIIATQIEQADAQIRLVDEHIARARLTAPFAGLVVAGDLTQAIGATVQRGQVLFEIAPLDSYRVMLEVDEAQIGDVSIGQAGRLVVSSLPGETIPVSVAKITPVSKAHDGRNFFRVEAALAGPAQQLRPGMRGIAKLDAGERQVAWIWTRSFVDWLRLFVWRWFG